jgi:hypothetical protein
MKRCLPSLLLALLVLAFSSNAALAAQPMTELEMLRAAYKTLAHADHDYQGHRVKAMHAIEAACDKLGTDIRGDGKAKETQPTSDNQLKDALAMLQQARTSAADSNQDAVVHHLDVAIKELGIALSIR